MDSIERRKKDSAADIPLPHGHSGVDGSTTIVRFKDSIQVLLTPLLLEALNKYVDALTDVVANVNPFSCLNLMHERTQDLVKGKIVDQESPFVNNKSPDHSPSSHDLPGTKNQSSKLAGIGVNLHLGRLDPISSQKSFRDPETPKESCSNDRMSSACCSPREEDEGRTGKEPTKLSCHIDEIKIMFLQSAVGQDKVPFSLLETFQDLTCVSLLVTVAQHLSCTVQLDVLADVGAPKRESNLAEANKPDEMKEGKAGQKFFRRHSGKKNNKKLASTLERAFHEKEREGESDGFKRKTYEIVGSFAVSKIHAQLRRLKNNATILDKVVKTAIPDEQSKVCFEFNGPPPSKLVETDAPCVSCCQPIEPAESVSDEKQRVAQVPLSSAVEPTMGFIMVECGLESISVKGACRIFPPKEGEKGDETDDQSKNGDATEANSCQETGETVENGDEREKGAKNWTNIQYSYKLNTTVIFKFKTLFILLHTFIRIV